MSISLSCFFKGFVRNETFTRGSFLYIYLSHNNRPIYLPVSRSVEVDRVFSPGRSMEFNYQTTYGITSNGDEPCLKFVTQSAQKNVGSRLYLTEDESTYEMFPLLGQEFTFDVDVLNLPCGLNAALYFVSMTSDGGMYWSPGDRAGAKYGTGYCDSHWLRDLKFIDDQANAEGWKP